MQYLSMKGFVVRLQTLRSIRGHDVLLDTTHDLLDSMVKSRSLYNQEPNGSHT